MRIREHECVKTRRNSIRLAKVCENTDGIFWCVKTRTHLAFSSATLNMNRKKFLKNGLLGLGSLVAAPTLLSSCKDKDSDGGGGTNPEDCKVTPTEIAGPFPIKTPADWVRENIIGNKAGVPLMINLKIEDINDDCKALVGASVDIWQCDAKGNYSEYSNIVFLIIDYRFHLSSGDHECKQFSQ